MAEASPALALAASPAISVVPASTTQTKASIAPTVGGPLAEAVVVFKTSGPSWVEVTDASGQVTLRRTMAAGESVGTAGNLPLAVVVGRADATQVSVRGQPLNLGPLSRDNVARFEVK